MRTTSRTSSSLTEPSGSQRKELIPIELDIIHTGDCLEILKTLPDDSVHCCVTSPPYYALRDYGMEAQIGRETTPKEYISRLTEVFTEVRRVLRPDGTLWLNISDTYAGKGNQGDFIDPKNPNGRNGQAVALNNKVEGCKPKDMIGIPWMLAFALRDTGWYLRNDIIWMKDNPMPESVKDRCARCYEHIFLFSKSKKYFFDYKAISEPIAPATAERLKRGMKGGNKYGKPVPGQPQPHPSTARVSMARSRTLTSIRSATSAMSGRSTPSLSRAVTTPPILRSWLRPVFSPVVPKTALCLTPLWEAAQPAWLPRRWGVISSASS